MGKNISAEIVADSINSSGNRITTFQLTYPRIVHAELMTHRVFSRNAASSRAVPIKKMIESVKNNMFTPSAIQKAHKGMQGLDYFKGEKLEQAKQLWVESAKLSLQQAEKMEKFGISKQLVNRILEPYQYYQALVTATEWENFFELRCPKYQLPLEIVKSKKEAIKLYPNIYSNFTELDWLKINQSQAEIHIQKIAEMMWDCYNENKPKTLQVGEWHIPYGDKFDNVQFTQYLIKKWQNQQAPTEGNLWERIRIATARAARISYTTLGDNPKIDYEADVKLHDQLLGSKHFSPFEHIAKCTDNVFDECGKDPLFEEGQTHIDSFGNLWSGNFKGWIQYRQLVQ